MYGAEYETNTLSDFMSKLVHHDVPCAVCLVRNRSIVKMFPGEKSGSQITETPSQDSKWRFGNRKKKCYYYICYKDMLHYLH